MGQIGHHPADNWPLLGMEQSGAKTYEEFSELIVAGKATNQPAPYSCTGTYAVTSGIVW